MRLEYAIKKEDEKKYFFLPFDIPDGVETLKINYSYKGDRDDARVTSKLKNVVDFGLLDENGDDVGTRGSEIKSVTISSHYSTSGFKKKKINKGTWTIIIGAYQIRPEGVNVVYDIEFEYTKLRWLKGDTHVHTDYSDGIYSREKLAKKAARKGLDYIIITDHNNNLDGIEMPTVQGLTVIKGVELTNYNGHLNLFGHAKPYDGSFAVNTKEEFLKHNKQAQEKGAIQVINHPMCTLCPWLMGFEEIHFDAIEVWNGPMRKDNLKTLDWWNTQLKMGKRIAITGGSDYHRDFFVTDLLAHPTLRVYVDNNSEDAILSAIKNGNSVITHLPNSTMVELSCNGAIVGQEVEFNKDLKLYISITKMKRKHKLKVIDTDGCYFEYTARKRGNYKFRVPVRSKGFVRCEIEYQKAFFARIIHKLAMFIFIKEEAREEIPPFKYVITNPIYFI